MSPWVCIHEGRSPSAREETATISTPDSRSIRFRREVECWFVELRDPVFRYLRTLGCQHALAEEITQETFLRFHQYLRSGFKVHDVRAWIFRVARNLWIDSRREHRRYWTGSRDEDRPDVSYGDSAPDPEQQAIQNEQFRMIEEKVSRLPELQRECVLLKAQGLSYREIAAVLGVSMTTAVDCVRRAVKRIGRLFHDPAAGK